MTAIFIALLLPCLGTAETLEIVTPSQGAQSFTLEELKSKLDTKTVSIDDPVYKTQKKFEGFLLKDILSLVGISVHLQNHDIVFTAKDGYAPNTSLKNLDKHVAFVVFQEADGRKFEPVQQGKKKVSPAPYYLVWSEGSKLAKELPWPYQLIRIEVANLEQKYDLALPMSPKPTVKVIEGFEVFKSQCIRCHSVNLQGGDLGPELNIPKNITEYRDTTYLIEFIRDASSFRARSKMPKFEHLSRKDVLRILDYLRYMGRHKKDISQSH